MFIPVDPCHENGSRHNTAPSPKNRPKTRRYRNTPRRRGESICENLQRKKRQPPTAHLPETPSLPSGPQPKPRTRPSPDQIPISPKAKTSQKKTSAVQPNHPDTPPWLHEALVVPPPCSGTSHRIIYGQSWGLSRETKQSFSRKPAQRILPPKMRKLRTIHLRQSLGMRPLRPPVRKSRARHRLTSHRNLSKEEVNQKKWKR